MPLIQDELKSYNVITEQQKYLNIDFHVFHEQEPTPWGEGITRTALGSSATTFEEPPPIVYSFPNKVTTVAKEVVASGRLGL